MKTFLGRPRRLALGSVISIGLFGWPASVGADETFSGQATVIEASLLGTPLPPVSATGPLPSSGGALEASLITVSQPLGTSGQLNAEVAHAATIGQGDRTRSEASVAALRLKVAGQSVSADFLMARAMAVCTSTGPSLSGSSELASLVINGQAVTISGLPNQTIPLGPNGSLGKVVINEQASSVSGRSGTLDVTALHVAANNPLGGSAADVVIAHVHADITCVGAPNCQSARDFITGGGWIRDQSGAKANFAVAGGIKNGALWGHLLFIDHGNGLRVKGTGVTSYMVVANSPQRKIFGTFDAPAPNNYESDVADNGEPGAGHDNFQLSLNSSLVTPASPPNVLGGGNIQLHKPCR